MCPDMILDNTDSYPFVAGYSSGDRIIDVGREVVDVCGQFYIVH